MATATQSGARMNGAHPGTGTHEARWTGTLTFAASATAQVLDVLFSKNADNNDESARIFGDFWLYIEENNASPTNVDDVDVQIQPIGINAAGTVVTTQQGATDIQNAADFNANDYQGFSLNEFFGVNGTKDLFIGGHGVRITLDPAASCTGTFVITLIVR